MRMNPDEIAELVARRVRPERAREVLPMVLPDPWRIAQENGDGCSYVGPGVYVIASVAQEGDGRDWLHVSLSCQGKLPNWYQVRAVKDLFIGKHRKAIQVLPAEAEYVNIHPHVLHLWRCLDGDPLPDFTSGTGSI